MKKAHNEVFSTPISFDHIVFYNIHKTAYTPWTFGRVTDTSGRTTLIELNGGPNDAVIAGLIREMMERLRHKEITGEEDVESLLGLTSEDIRSDPRDRVLSCAVSALRTAVVNLQAQLHNLPLQVALCGKWIHDSVPLYANLNRHIRSGTQPNSPYINAEAAELAVAEGFFILKCAPFEEVQPESDEADLKPGLDRIDAIQDAVGSNVAILVDCHSRFDLKKAIKTGYTLQERGIEWYEEPVDIYGDTSNSRWLRETLDIPLASAESGYGLDFFQRILTEQAADIIMPDIKYCGGVQTAYQAGREAKLYGARISLHSPTGPVCALTSAHVSAALPDSMPLEYAPLEVPWRGDLLDPPERVKKGQLYLPPGAGLGADLNQDTVDRYGTRWDI